MYYNKANDYLCCSLQTDRESLTPMFPRDMNRLLATVSLPKALLCERRSIQQTSHYFLTVITTGACGCVRVCAYSCSWFFRARQSRPSIRPCRLNLRCILSSWYIFVLAGRSRFNVRLFDEWCAIPVSLSHCARLCAVWVWVRIPVHVCLVVRLPPSVRGLLLRMAIQFRRN